MVARRSSKYPPKHIALSGCCEGSCETARRPRLLSSTEGRRHPTLLDPLASDEAFLRGNFEGHTSQQVIVRSRHNVPRRGIKVGAGARLAVGVAVEHHVFVVLMVVQLGRAAAQHASVVQPHLSAQMGGDKVVLVGLAETDAPNLVVGELPASGFLAARRRSKVDVIASISPTDLVSVCLQQRKQERKSDRNSHATEVVGHPKFVTRRREVHAAEQRFACAVVIRREGIGIENLGRHARLKVDRAS